MEQSASTLADGRFAAGMDDWEQRPARDAGQSAAAPLIPVDDAPRGTARASVEIAAATMLAIMKETNAPARPAIPPDLLALNVRQREDKRRRSGRMEISFTPDPSLYPFESKWFDSSAGRVHYIEEGSGTPILLCHGNPTWSFLYRDIVTRLRDRFRCLAIDYLGFDLSGRTE